MQPSPANAVITWTHAGGGPDRAGLFPASVAPEARNPRRLSVHGAVQAAVVFDSAGQVYAADLAGWVHSWDSRGRLRWQRPLEGAVSASPALDVAGGRLFVGTHAGQAYALAADNGRVLWQRRLPTRSDPRILSDCLFLYRPGWVVLSSWGERFYALEAETGNPVRQWEAGPTPRAAASADAEGTLYFLRATHGRGVSLVRMPPQDEEQVLLTEPEGERGVGRTLVQAAPVVDTVRRRVWCVLNNGRGGALVVWSLDTRRLEARWTFERSLQAAPALTPDGAALQADLAGGLQALDPQAGQTPRGQYRTEAEYLTAAAVCDGAGRAFLADPLGCLHQVEPSGNGRVLFEAPRAFLAPLAFDPSGNLYVPGADRHIYVFTNRPPV